MARPEVTSNFTHQRRLDAEGYRYRAINAGVSGNRTHDGLARLDDDVLRYRPVITVVELGSNDPGHTVMARWRADLQRIVTTLQKHGSRVVLGGLDQPGMTAVYRGVASDTHIPLVWITTGLWSRPGLWGDAHHPNGQGYRVVTQNVWRSLSPMLKR